VRKNNYTNGLFAALLLVSPLVGADQKYPAANFEPEVVFQDNDYISKNSQSSDQEKPSNKVNKHSNEQDSKYPAANFEPQVVYSDANYKPSTDTQDEVKTSNKHASSSLGNEPQITEVTSATTSEKSDSSPNYLIGLIGLGVVGFFLFKKQSESTANKVESKKAAGQSLRNVNALTGVAKYLNRSAGTGVSRYVDKQVKSAASATGVAKYMAKQVVSAKKTSDEAATTGVEKYMRNRS
jgi:hypothetical protein